MPSVLDTTSFALAEQCAIRLDGDGFALGDGLIAADEPDGPVQRAASLATATAPYDLVLVGWTAAWVHGATDLLRRPLQLATESDGGSRSKVVPVREVAFGPRDVVRIGGVRVTSVFRTAADLARLEPALRRETVAVLDALIATAGLTWRQAVAALVATPVAPGRLRALARFRARRDGDEPV
ncbi:MAG TPA: hypothetical protein VIG76_01035 [Amnibacterium sp.]|jgi:hypothetical protein|uniref:hypothetical protein n=1 Tax=Amnibacterium sp. TaxID=1872496 RepID=UPI002F9267BD